jgi:hypothetical protein
MVDQTRPHGVVVDVLDEDPPVAARLDGPRQEASAEERSIAISASIEPLDEALLDPTHGP